MNTACSRRPLWSTCATLLCALVASCAPASQSGLLPTPAHASIQHAADDPGLAGASRVKHVVVIMMENRSFDSYFGTYPGVNGIPSDPTCNPDPDNGKCILPWHDASLTNQGGPHAINAMTVDLDHGKLDGFIKAAIKYGPDPRPEDVMGYHTCAEIPLYCQYAANGVLADNHFAATNSWSAMAHLFLVSGWSAQCKTPDPMSCTSSNNQGQIFAWTDITWLLHSYGISWGYYVWGTGQGSIGPQPDEGPDGDGEGPPLNPWVVSQPGAWNPLPGFEDVRSDNELANVQVGSNFIAAAKAGTLPAVSWVIPSFSRSDHPPSSIAFGQDWVKRQVDAVMNGPDASSTLILLTWDEWGGFYDHVIPPVIDSLGYGFRTPLIMIGQTVKPGTIDHQLLTSDAYLKLIEDLFMGSARLDPNTDGRPDSRPDVRENVAGLGDLRNDLQ